MNCDGAERGEVGRIKETVNGFVRSVWFEPGYDHWTTPCSKGHGRHGMQLRFLLQGEEGAVQFLMFTGWMPGGGGEPTERTMAADLGYHWIRPWYESQTWEHQKCGYLADAPCFYDGSGLNAEAVMALFFEHGSEALWQYLEAEYRGIADEASALAKGA